MFSDTVAKFRQGYAYYLGVMLLAILGGVLVSWLFKLISPADPTLEFLMNIDQNQLLDKEPAEMGELFQQFIQARSENLSSTWYISLLASILNAFISLITTRSIFQKLNFPEMRIGDSALFHTNPLKIITLPIKSFFANLIGILVMILFVFAGGFGLFYLASQNNMFSIFSAIAFLLILLAVSVFLTPINPLIAYDVDGRYNFWTTFTKSLSIGHKYFWRIVKTLVVTFLLLVISIGLFTFVIFYLSSQHSIVIGGLLALVFLLFLLLWLAPFVQLYLINTLNTIFHKEY